MKFLYSNCELSYEDLLDKARSSTLNIKKLCFLYKRYWLNLNACIYNQNLFGKISFRIPYLEQNFEQSTLPQSFKTEMELIASVWFLKRYISLFLFDSLFTGIFILLMFLLAVLISGCIFCKCNLLLS